MVNYSKKGKIMLKRILFTGALIFGSYVYAQKSECKVNIPDISGNYTGDCKKGLAHGKGVAQGIDRYEGQFVKGLPEGKGVYKWADGTYYDGQWKNGMREGSGKMVYRDSVVTGYWKENKYQGEKPKQVYEISRSQNIGRSTFTKTDKNASAINIRIMRSGSDNMEIEELSLASSSGSENRNLNYYSIIGVTFPVEVTVRYRVWNQMHTFQSDAMFEFKVFEPGSWEVLIFN